MKKLSCLLVLSLLLPSMGLAKGNHGMAGCGVGYVLFAHKDNTKKSQLISYLINTFVVTPTFGMTSGTSGCTEDGAPKWVRAAEVFAEANYESLKKEMALGEGEYVTTFASLLGSPETKTGELVQLMKNEYQAIIPTENTTHQQMLENLSKVVVSHPGLIG